MSLYVKLSMQEIADGLTAIGWSGAGGGGDASLSYGATAPLSPTNGTLWYDTTEEILKLFRVDAWVDINVTQSVINNISAQVALAQTYAQDAQEALAGFTSIVATATTLAPEASATATFNAGTGVLTLGIPKGPQGIQGLPGEVTAQQLADGLATKAAAVHNHDGSYYTKSEVAALLANASSVRLAQPVVSGTTVITPYMALTMTIGNYDASLSYIINASNCTVARDGNTLTITNPKSLTPSFTIQAVSASWDNEDSTTAVVSLSTSQIVDTAIKTQKAIFGYGTTGSLVSLTNLVSNTGIVATDTTGVGTARSFPSAASYGLDKAIFGYGNNGSNVSMTNLVSNTGIVSADVSGVGTARLGTAAASYGLDKAIFGYGNNGSNVSMTNLVSNTGIVSTDTTGVGTARHYPAAASYGSDKAIFGYGFTDSYVSMTNLVSNTGIVSADVSGVGTARGLPAAASYGSDKAIFGYGSNGYNVSVSMTNLVSNTGVVATDITGVGTARYGLASASYDLDKAIFGYGMDGSLVSLTNLVSNTGIVATDTTGAGTARYCLAAAGFSLT